MLTTDRIFEEFKTHVGDSVIEKTEFIRMLNKLGIEIKLTKPAEQLSKIFYCKDWDKYPLPTLFRAPISMRSSNKNFISYVSPYMFALRALSEVYSEQSDAGVRYVLIRHAGTDSAKSLVTECDNLTADGAWSIAGGSALAIQTNEKKSGAGSLEFSASALQTIVTFIRTNIIDVSGYTEHLRQRFFSKMPTVASNVKVRIGSDASNYFEHELTTQVTGQVFTTDEFNELEFSRQSATETGTVDLTAITWFQFEFNFPVAVTDSGFLLDKIELIKPEPLDFEWYTSAVALDENGLVIERVTEDINTTDTVLYLNYPNYLPTVLDGLGYLFFKNRGSVESKQIYYNDFLAKKANRKLVSGLAYLEKLYPDRSAQYRRAKRLPELYKNYSSNLI